MNDVGIVVIGRDEGERLRLCLESLLGRGVVVVYVDSGSTDGSVAVARGLGAKVVELATSIPFTAARARNTGVEHLRQIAPGARFVQFVDGDCEVVDGWLGRARAELVGQPELAVVFGRLRERYPERTIYNRMADIEWDGPVGTVESCGGIAMMRMEAFCAVNGFDPALIAGEESDLCLRLRRRGWRIARVDAPMALHDLAMSRFGQWWRRTVRAGHATAEGAARHGRSPERHCIRESRSVVVWGIAAPMLVALSAGPTRGASLLLLSAYPALTYRIYRARRRCGLSPGDARGYALLCVVGKFAQAVGHFKYWTTRACGRHCRLIEYKNAAA